MDNSTISYFCDSLVATARYAAVLSIKSLWRSKDYANLGPNNYRLTRSDRMQPTNPFLSYGAKTAHQTPNLINTGYE